MCAGAHTKVLSLGWEGTGRANHDGFTWSCAELQQRLFLPCPAINLPNPEPMLSFQCCPQLASHQRFPGPLQGNLRTMPVPGSARVLDRGSGRLVPCTVERCPYATRVVQPGTGEEVYVNKVNWVGTASFAINR